MGEKSVAIIGTGLIGRGWAAAFARAGWDVALWDRDRASCEAAQAFVGEVLADLAAPGEPVKAANVRVADTLADAVSGASYIQESLPEQREIKAAVFQAIDDVAHPDAIAGSSTSTMPGSTFLADIPGRARCIVAHPANPPHLMPVVEIVPASFNDEAVVARIREILTSIGQVPVVVLKEIEGFVMNRLQAALINESMSLVARGAISPADLDAVIKYSLGMRWAFMGPFETMDLNAPSGFLDYARRYGASYAKMGRELNVAAPWDDAALETIEETRRAAVPAEDLAERMRWRDRALTRLLALKQHIDN